VSADRVEQVRELARLGDAQGAVFCCVSAEPAGCGTLVPLRVVVAPSRRVLE
jgi:hypothetical protein